VTFEGHTLSYTELDRRANRVAHRLRELGVGPDSLVALSAERSLELVVGLLGILKAGGAYVPLDPAYPRDRLEFMLEDSGAKVLVTHGSISHSGADSLSTVRVEDTTDGPESRVDSRARPGQLAYVIYTSGSTGRPKGVLITHANVARLFESTRHWFEFRNDDVWSLFHSYAFDFSVWELWGALLYGGRVVVVPYGVSRSPDAFLDLLDAERVTVLSQTPSAFRQLARAACTEPAPRKLALRTVVFGGEALELQGLRPWLERFGDEKPRLVNMYGITESCVHVTYRPIRLTDVDAGLGSVIGVPIPDLDVHLLKEDGLPSPQGEPGEIFVEGAGLARGYLNRPDLTEARFVTKVIGGKSRRTYRTGDLARRLPSGELEYLGRIDQQVKIRGFRIELGEIESVLAEHASVREVVVVARDDMPGGDRRLVAYVSVSAPTSTLVADLRARAAARLPEYMLPAAIVVLPKLPLTENGKVDRRALPPPDVARPALRAEYLPPEGPTEEAIARVWQRLLRVDRVGRDDTFFELGGSSLLAVESMLDLRTEIGHAAPIVVLFQHPTVRGLARALARTQHALAATERRDPSPQSESASRRDAIAIVGMAGRFPGASTVEALWQNLCDGVESVRFFTDAELDPSVDRSSPSYVKARGVLEGADEFDAEFFGETGANAALIDPQQRILLQVCWAALEDAGLVADRAGGPIGVFAGTGHNTYLRHNVLERPDRVQAMGELAVTLANDKDFVATRVAHKLDLKGPALSVHTACSTSLVAVWQAVQSLRNGDCDAALAGAASITFPQNAGHLHTADAMLSADGHTRPFDAAGTGTVFSDGAAAVVLKRLSDAERDGDRVYAVILGGAVNNDGADKASFMAPSVAGQAEAITRAHADARVDPATIAYVEAHGTATPLGDPVEVAALTQAFHARTSATGFCALGSIKSNLGHLTAASGVAGLIKTALSLHHRKLPPSLFFESPNPNIAFSSTPFFVQRKLADWHAPEGQPRRAGVSSFGVGGTNAHVVLEEAPAPSSAGAGRPVHVFALSAKTESALDAATRRLADFVEARTDVELDDVAYTLTVRRSHFVHRRVVVAASREEAVKSLRSLEPPVTARGAPQVAFVFPGQGTQYPGMGRALYDAEPIFRRAVDACAEVLRPVMGRDLRDVVFEREGRHSETLLRQTMFTQPALFMIGYALASLHRAMGVEPTALAGHSVGEFVAACIAGVFSLEDAATLVAQRGRLMQALPTGSMLSVRLPASELEQRLPPGLDLAASNGPSLSVASGPSDAIAQLEGQLGREGVVVKHLHTSHAFHSSMMDPAVEPFADLVRRVRPKAPRIPIVSSATGSLLTEAEAMDPMYWARHLRVPVRFVETLRTLWSVPSRLILEVGPRSTSATLARQIAPAGARHTAISILEDTVESENQSVARALARLWCARVPVDWMARHATGSHRVVSLPAYPFARTRHFIEPGTQPRVRQDATATTALPDALEDAQAIDLLFQRQLGLMEAQLDALAAATQTQRPIGGRR
jgi:amino acid adenylation domain-containing protein